MQQVQQDKKHATGPTRLNNKHLNWRKEIYVKIKINYETKKKQALQPKNNRSSQEAKFEKK